MRAKWRISKTLHGREQSPITREADPRRDPARLALVRSLGCAVKLYPFPGATPCRGGIEAHHPTGAGMALTDDDRKAFGLCLQHHVPEFHGLTGAFKGWTKARRREWQTRMSEAYARGCALVAGGKES